MVRASIPMVPKNSTRDTRLSGLVTSKSIIGAVGNGVYGVSCFIWLVLNIGVKVICKIGWARVLFHYKRDAE